MGSVWDHKGQMPVNLKKLFKGLLFSNPVSISLMQKEINRNGVFLKQMGILVAREGQRHRLEIHMELRMAPVIYQEAPALNVIHAVGIKHASILLQ